MSRTDQERFNLFLAGAPVELAHATKQAFEQLEARLQDDVGGRATFDETPHLAGQIGRLDDKLDKILAAIHAMQ